MAPSISDFNKTLVKSNLHFVNVLYRFLNAFNKARLTIRIKSKMARIIISILTEVGVSVMVAYVVATMGYVAATMVVDCVEYEKGVVIVGW